jgi:benzoyl-CoA reductase subunit A
VVGVDLGSTTTKAVLLDEEGRILGRGITNSRSNYDLAVEVARTEAFVTARFELLHRRVAQSANPSVFDRLVRAFRMEQLVHQGRRLRALIDEDIATIPPAGLRSDAGRAVAEIFRRFEEEEEALFLEPEPPRRSDFFRDIMGSTYTRLAEEIGKEAGPNFDLLLGLYDKCILRVENEPMEIGFRDHIDGALARIGNPPVVAGAVEEAVTQEIPIAASVGTGYGRMRLPFPKEQIRSEILCHGLGAHAMFPETRTVLDIGGQDTKAVQVDADGIVTSFQMNDRCAAGCGRYLGYIADEMNLGLHELGPLAERSDRPVKINSTCTVFAGAELRDRLALGERREDILAGLHRAIMLRAMSLLARSGGISNEFTFTGGVARNPAAVRALGDLVRENYGERTLNISPDSIFTGALGAALFAHSVAVQS